MKRPPPTTTLRLTILTYNTIYQSKQHGSAGVAVRV
jgi:hypothetical protein